MELQCFANYTSIPVQLCINRVTPAFIIIMHLSLQSRSYNQSTHVLVLMFRRCLRIDVMPRYRDVKTRCCQTILRRENIRCEKDIREDKISTIFGIEDGTYSLSEISVKWHTLLHVSRPILGPKHHQSFFLFNVFSVELFVIIVCLLEQLLIFW